MENIPKSDISHTYKMSTKNMYSKHWTSDDKLKITGRTVVLTH
jgi:hypothetical protein